MNNFWQGFLKQSAALKALKLPGLKPNTQNTNFLKPKVPTPKTPGTPATKKAKGFGVSSMGI